MGTSLWVPTIGILKREGFTHHIEGESVNGGKYKGYMNADNVMFATCLFVRWEWGGSLQVAHKVLYERPEAWKFKGFGWFQDEAHFLRLLAGPHAAPLPDDYISGQSNR